MDSLRSLGGALAGLLLFTTLSFAQGTADIVGRVTDASGGVLPAVTVTAENIATKNVRTTVTTDTGDYVFTLLPIGIYTVKIELQGFQRRQRQGRTGDGRPRAGRREAADRDRRRECHGDGGVASAADRLVNGQLADQSKRRCRMRPYPAATSSAWCR